MFELREARSKGMVERYNIDVGWEFAFTAYNFYGESGGSAANIAATEVCLHAIRREMRLGVRQPSLVWGPVTADVTVASTRVASICTADVSKRPEQGLDINGHQLYTCTCSYTALQEVGHAKGISSFAAAHPDILRLENASSDVKKGPGVDAR